MAIHTVQVPIGNPNYTISINDGQAGPAVSHHWPDLINAHCRDFYGFGDWSGQVPINRPLTYSWIIFWGAGQKSFFPQSTETAKDMHLSKIS